MIGQADQSMVPGMLTDAFEALDDGRVGTVKVATLIKDLDLNHDEAEALKAIIDPTDSGMFKYEGVEELGKSLPGSPSLAELAAAAYAADGLPEVGGGGGEHELRGAPGRRVLADARAEGLHALGLRALG